MGLDIFGNYPERRDDDVDSRGASCSVDLYQPVTAIRLRNSFEEVEKRWLRDEHNFTMKASLKTIRDFCQVFWIMKTIGRVGTERVMRCIWQN